MKRILVTGSAGFIGSNLVLRLFKELGAVGPAGAANEAGATAAATGVGATATATGAEAAAAAPVTIVGLDNMNAYYDPALKEYRLQEIEKARPAGIDYTFVKGNIADKALVDSLFEQYRFDVVVNLAAQAGVRYSIENPGAYMESNIM